MSGQDQDATTPTILPDEAGKVQESAATKAYSLNSSPSHLLHRAQQVAADLHAAVLGTNGLTQRQCAVLAVLAAQDGVSQSDLVARTGIDRSTLAEMVARMEAKGLTQRAKSKTDSRANSVTLTAEGRAMYEGAAAQLADIDQAVLARLPATKRAGFIELLMRLTMPQPSPEDQSESVKKKKDKKKKKKKDKKSK